MEYINNHTQEDFEDAVGDMTELTPEQEDYILEQGREEDYNKKERAKEFLNCLGNGKTIHECEEENDFLDDPRLEDEKEVLEK